MSKELAGIIAKRFIQRRDIKAVQFENGAWSPDTEAKYGNHGHGFDFPSLMRHLNKEATYGHYLLDADSHSRVFVFDIDLDKTGNYVELPGISSGEGLTTGIDDQTFDANTRVFEDVSPRDLWLTRTPSAAPARAWYKMQMRLLAHRFTAAVTELGLPCAAAYSGSKGVHVYGFTGDLPAAEVREAALLTLDMVGDFVPHRGQVFYKHKNPDPIRGFANFTVEVFPKQSSLDGKSLGNLVRLPLGRNQKSSDPTFFLDMKAPMAELRPHPDPVELLTTGNAYV